jgi:hypothetical protein
MPTAPRDDTRVPRDDIHCGKHHPICADFHAALDVFGPGDFDVVPA